jgi:sulfatase modifying factor 1
MAGTALALALVPSCERSAAPPPPQGEVVLAVDTDMPVPTFVNRLRVDVYDAGGTWYQSRDVDRSRPADWPSTFAFDLDLTGGQAEEIAIVRLRAYASGNSRDYRGERFAPFVVQCDSPACAQATPPPPTCCPLHSPDAVVPTNQPRLLDAQQVDITPATEPEPALAIDRIVVLDLLPDRASLAQVVLQGACAGTMADVAGVRSCTDTTGQLDDVSAPVAVLPDGTPLAASVAGTFHGAPVPCTETPRPPGSAADGTPLHDEEVCVPGGMFVFGDSAVFGQGPVDDAPPRIAILPPFLMGKYEVTVARWRAALAGGFVNPNGPSSPLANEGPLPTSGVAEDSNALCTWSLTRSDREEYGINCLAWKDAHAFCQSLGGELPTEPQFEYAAMAAGRDFKTRYPWGGDDAVQPPCSRAVYGRGTVDGFDDECNQNLVDTGPLPVTAPDHDAGDVTPQLGIVGLGGSDSEWQVDAFAPLTANCWASAPLLSPTCTATTPPTRAVRGGSWRVTPLEVIPSVRSFGPGSALTQDVGFRCVRPGSSP